MIKQLDPHLVNILANHPDVRPTFESGDYVLDATDIIRDPANAVYANATTVVIFIGQGEGVYAIHVASIPEGRGLPTVKAIRAAIDALKGSRTVSKVVAAVPLQLRAARMLGRLLGFKSQGTDTQQEFFVLEEQ